MHSIARLLLIAAFTAGCSDGPTDPNLPGRYVLRSVDNRDVPALTYADSMVQITILSARVDLAGDSSFTDVAEYRTTPTGGTASTQRDSVAGTYSLSGDKINFLTSEGDTYQMVWQPSRLTYYAEGRTFRYTR